MLLDDHTSNQIGPTIRTFVIGNRLPEPLVGLLRHR
jgi:hypothetical protein